MAKQRTKEKSSYQKEKELARYVIKELKNPSEEYPGICRVLERKMGESYNILKEQLPKLYKYLSQRNNYCYSTDGFMGRINGNHVLFYWIPYKHTNRIKTLKKVYNIK